MSAHRRLLRPLPLLAALLTVALPGLLLTGCTGPAGAGPSPEPSSSAASPVRGTPAAAQAGQQRPGCTPAHPGRAGRGPGLIPGGGDRLALGHQRRERADVGYLARQRRSDRHQDPRRGRLGQQRGLPILRYRRPGARGCPRRHHSAPAPARGALRRGVRGHGLGGQPHRPGRRGVAVRRQHGREVLARRRDQAAARAAGLRRRRPRDQRGRVHRRPARAPSASVRRRTAARPTRRRRGPLRSPPASCSRCAPRAGWSRPACPAACSCSPGPRRRPAPAPCSTSATRTGCR